MTERRFGRIVNISVSFIKFPQVNFGHTHAARLALAGAIAAMVRELAPFNVTINSVCPGFFDTEGSGPISVTMRLAATRPMRQSWPIA